MQGRSPETFPYLLVLGRPASGKSEFIDYMSRTPAPERAHRYAIGDFGVLDDFVFLWQHFLQDDESEKQGKPRRLSKPSEFGYVVASDDVWDVLTNDINTELAARWASDEQPGRTTLVEFSRGRNHGYQRSLSHLAPRLLQLGAILHIQVSFEESWRRNLARYDEKRRSGILTHSVPRAEMERTYGEDDWSAITGGKPNGYLHIRGNTVPFVTMFNEPESTDPRVLDRRYGYALMTLKLLWDRIR
jgi:hypothetical protein